jgi:hypothetical protein
MVARAAAVQGIGNADTDTLQPSALAEDTARTDTGVGEVAD